MEFLVSHIEMEQDPVSLAGTNPFCVPYVLENRLYLVSLKFPEFQRAESNSCLSNNIRNAETKQEQSKNNSLALGTDFLFFLKEHT